MGDLLGHNQNSELGSGGCGEDVDISDWDVLYRRVIYVRVGRCKLNVISGSSNLIVAHVDLGRPISSIGYELENSRRHGSVGFDGPYQCYETLLGLIR
jgi:hypothetical protein